MTVKVSDEQQVVREAVDVLLKHMSPAKVARFLAVCRVGDGDYLAIRRRLFDKESVATLFEKVRKYENRKK
ncbi:MAG: hypothetical protein FJ272_18430 [Planctomycetes bacterium]|nr:hypothetical protein [Planctomycetota bacterium]